MFCIIYFYLKKCFLSLSTLSLSLYIYIIIASKPFYKLKLADYAYFRFTCACRQVLAAKFILNALLYRTSLGLNGQLLSSGHLRIQDDTLLQRLIKANTD